MSQSCYTVVSLGPNQCLAASPSPPGGEGLAARLGPDTQLTQSDNPADSLLFPAFQSCYPAIHLSVSQSINQSIYLSIYLSI